MSVWALDSFDKELIDDAYQKLDLVPTITTIHA